MKKLKFIKKNIKKIVILLVILIVALIGLTTYAVLNNKDFHDYKSELFSIKYDKYWTEKKSDNLNLSLAHSSGSTVGIQVTVLDDESKNTEISEIVSNFKYSVNKNEKYNLLSEEPSRITALQFDCYRLLYEKDDRQTLIIIGKKSDRVYTMSFNADSKHFDILLDSAMSAFHSFSLTEKTYALDKAAPIKTTDFSFDKNNTNCDLTKTSEYSIMKYGYKIIYSIPGCFESQEFDTTSGYFEYTEVKSTFDKSSIVLLLNIKDMNAYDFHTSNEIGALHNDIFNKNADIKTMKLDNSYVSSIVEDTHKQMLIIKDISPTKLLEITLSSRSGLNLSKEIVDSIKVIKTEKYGKNISLNYVDGIMTDSLKRTNYSNDIVYEVSYKLPVDYIEQDTNNNKFTERLFYNSPNTTKYGSVEYKYQANISLDLTRDIESYEKLEKNFQSKNQTISDPQTFTKNGIQFKKYIHKWYNDSGLLIKYKYLILTQLDTASDGLYIIELSNINNVDGTIPETMVNDFTNIIINKSQIGE